MSNVWPKHYSVYYLVGLLDTFNPKWFRLLTCKSLRGQACGYREVVEPKTSSRNTKAHFPLSCPQFRRITKMTKCVISPAVLYRIALCLAPPTHPLPPSWSGGCGPQTRSPRPSWWPLAPGCPSPPCPYLGNRCYTDQWALLHWLESQTLNSPFCFTGHLNLMIVNIVIFTIVKPLLKSNCYFKKTRVKLFVLGHSTLQKQVTALSWHQSAF